MVPDPQHTLDVGTHLQVIISFLGETFVDLILVEEEVEVPLKLQLAKLFQLLRRNQIQKLACELMGAVQSECVQIFKRQEQVNKYLFSCKFMMKDMNLFQVRILFLQKFKSFVGSVGIFDENFMVADPLNDLHELHLIIVFNKSSSIFFLLRLMFIRAVLAWSSSSVSCRLSDVSLLTDGLVFLPKIASIPRLIHFFIALIV